MESFWLDVKFALRSLRHNPGFTLVAVLTIVLGIGATTAIFSVVNGVVLNTLPFEDSDRLVQLWTTNRESGLDRNQWSIQDFADVRAQSQSIERMTGMLAYDATILDENNNAFKVPAQLVSWDAFDMLGIPVYVGRGFTSQDALPGTDQVFILSHEIWETYFGANPDLIGSTISAEGGSITIIGIMPPNFRFPRGYQVWTQIVEDVTQNRRARYLDVLAKLRDGVSLEAAQTDLDLIASRLEAEYPNTNRNVGISAQHYQDVVLGDLARQLWILLAAAGVLLVVASVNVANLLLARGAARNLEISLRSALGAGRSRITRQLLTESLVMAGGGAVGGIVMAAISIKLVKTLTPAELSLVQQAEMNGPVLIFAVGVTLLTGVLFGLLPSLRVGNPDLKSSLTDGGKSTTGGLSSSRLRNVLVTAELGMAVVLVVGAGLLLRSFANLTRADPGFNPSNLLTFELSAAFGTYQGPSTVRGLWSRALEQMQSVPGIQGVGAISGLPFGAELDYRISTFVDGRPIPEAGDETQVYWRQVTPGFFSLVGAPMVAGREFDDTHRIGGQRVAVINERAARLLFPDEDAVGERLIRLPSNAGPLGWYSDTLQDPTDYAEIIGVVSDIKFKSLTEQQPDPTVYLVLDQSPFRRMNFVARTSGDPLTYIQTFREKVATVDANIPVWRPESMARIIAGSYAGQRFAMVLLGAFAAIALILASIGIYGVVSYGVEQRTTELAVRIAVGADPPKVVALVMRHGGILAGFGVGIGLVTAWAAGRILASQLFGVTTHDPITFGLVAFVLTGIALAATGIPALRATRIAPAVALKPK